MKHASYKNIILAGTGKLMSSIAANLLSGTSVLYVLSEDVEEDKKFVVTNIADLKKYKNVTVDVTNIRYLTTLQNLPFCDLAICITAEDLSVKTRLIRQLEEVLPPDTTIAVNLESFMLDEVQKNAKCPERIIGVNWCEPAHTTSFLEVITNTVTLSQPVDRLESIAACYWDKELYTVNCGYSVKARMMGALTREAFFLVENGYASIEDIDRACRNDAGYYLPFSGNCRYMDLMGTYAYGLVMKDLNRELSKQTQLPEFFLKLIHEGKTGMEAKGGFYEYLPEEISGWEEKFRKFSFEIKEIIDKYPFDYVQEETGTINSKIAINE